MYILGISAYYHDSAATLIYNGEIIAAAQEERFTRKKHDPNFPINAISFCINEANISFEQIDYCIFYDKPFLKFERLLETYLAFAPRGFKSFSLSMPVWLKQKLFQKSTIINEIKRNFGKNINIQDKLLFSEHHLSHAASAFFPSPFEESAILTLDGVGEWASTSVSLGNKNNISPLKEINFPHSLGLLYSAFTFYNGFKVNSGEYKLMGLAPYGEPKYVDLIKDELIEIKSDGSFSLNLNYFDYCVGLKMTNQKFSQLFKDKPRSPESKLTQKNMDLAASIQSVIEEVVIKLCKNIRLETGQKNLCLAGGVALNCVANGKLLKENIFENIYIQPASGDAGGSLGAALCAYYMFKKKKRLINYKYDSMKGSFLGPNFTNNQIQKTLEDMGANYTYLDEDNIIKETVMALKNGKAIGWMQGKMEFGPRALGARSIIADPRSVKMQKQLNLKVKYRESFRPFAPSILIEHLNEWFDIDKNKSSPYMLIVADIVKEKQIPTNEKDENLFGIEKLNLQRSSLPAITHVDYSARIQTVHKETNRLYHILISKFYDETGCPALVNTSFNVRGEPIVCNPEDAFKCFMGTDLDSLVIGNYFLKKEDQNEQLRISYLNKYKLD